MPMHNAARSVESSIGSVLGQTFTDWELVVVNDSSTDDSYAIVAALAERDPRIVLTDNTGERGAAHARNVAIDLARGRYIAFLDSDDMWLPPKLERQMQRLSTSGGALSYTWYAKIDSHTVIDPQTFTPNKRLVTSPLHLTYRHMLRQDYIGFLTAIYDSHQLGKRYFPPLKRRQDYAMLLQIMREGHDAYGVGEPLALYRAARSGSLSSNKFKAAQYNWHIYRRVEQLSLGRAIVAFVNYAVRSGAKYLI